MDMAGRERVTSLAKQIVAEMEKHKAVKLLKDRETVFQAVVLLLADGLRRDEERQLAVGERLSRTKGSPSPGSKEWDAMFRKLLDDEYERQGFELP